MSFPSKKPSRAATLARLEAVSDAAVGPNDAIDAAFAAIEAAAGDPGAMVGAQARLRALLAPDAPDTAGLVKRDLA
jgi:hypothetical protein